MTPQVLIVNRALPAHVAGGLERHVEDLALGLAAAGLRPHVLAAPLPSAERDRLQGLGLTIHDAPSDRPARYSLGYLRGVGPCIERLHARFHYDLIHAQEFALGFWVPPPDAPPLVLTVHGTILSETPLHRDCRGSLSLGRWPWAVARFGRRLAYGPAWRRHLRAARRILTDSAFTRRELERLAPECREKMYSVPLAVRQAGAPPPDRQEARRRLGWLDEAPGSASDASAGAAAPVQLLTIGRLEWQKGQEMAILALAEAAGDRAWRYWIVGEGSERPYLERLVARLGLADRVRLLGRVSEDAKLDLLAAADLLVWPERTHPAFGLAALEAMLSRTPVLATPRGAAPEVLGDQGGWLAADATPEALRAALEPLLADPSLLAARRAGLREWALARFDFDRMIQAVLAHYQAVDSMAPPAE
jgi:glycosyltransferase involved in cell wall biosynthesis